MKNLEKALKKLGITVVAGRVKKSDIKKALSATTDVYSFEAKHSHDYNSGEHFFDADLWIDVSRVYDDDLGTQAEAEKKAKEYGENTLRFLQEQADSEDVNIETRIMVYGPVKGSEKTYK